MKYLEDWRWSDVWGFESGFIKFSLSQLLPTQTELYALSLYLFFIAVCLCVEPQILRYLQREFRLSSFIPENGSSMFHHNFRISQHHCTLSGSRKLQSSYGELFVILVTQFHPWIQYIQYIFSYWRRCVQMDPPFGGISAWFNTWSKFRLL